MQLNKTNWDEKIDQFISPILKDNFNLTKVSKRIWVEELESDNKRVVALLGNFFKRGQGILIFGRFCPDVPLHEYALSLGKFTFSYRRTNKRAYLTTFDTLIKSRERIGSLYSRFPDFKDFVLCAEQDFEKNCNNVLNNTLPYIENYFEQTKSIPDLINHIKNYKNRTDTRTDYFFPTKSSQSDDATPPVFDDYYYILMFLSVKIRDFESTKKYFELWSSGTNREGLVNPDVNYITNMGREYAKDIAIIKEATKRELNRLGANIS